MDMVSRISFTSTYKVNNQNSRAFHRFQAYALNKECEINDAGTILKQEVTGSYPFVYKAEQTLVVPDKYDTEVEEFCTKNNIKFKKHETRELLNPKSIKSRIQDAPKNYRKAEINIKKFMGFVQNQKNNIKHCRNDYENFYKKDINTILKSGDLFPATTLYINTTSNDADYLEEYIKRFGSNLNSEQISFDFSQRTDSADHCMFFALQDLGVENIPVYVDDNSYKIGSILGLFS